MHGIPVFSLYGEVRRPTGQMMSTFDVLLVDLQDLGCRIYTFITTLLYVLEAAAEHGKTVWVLDRPNPVGRPVEGSDPASRLGKLRRRRADADAPWPDARRTGPVVHQATSMLDVDYRVIEMEGWRPRPAPGYRLAAGERAWINPQPQRRRTSGWRALMPAP